jgi:hypothetical protein
MIRRTMRIARPARRIAQAVDLEHYKNTMRLSRHFLPAIVAGLDQTILGQGFIGVERYPRPLPLSRSARRARLGTKVGRRRRGS